MKGLIRKDFCQWKNYAKQYALMLVVFFGIGIALKSPEYTAFYDSDHRAFSYYVRIQYG